MASESAAQPVIDQLADPVTDTTPDVVDGVAIARLYGEPLFKVPDGLYIPPDALEVFLESFEGPLDLLLYLIRKQKFDVMHVPMALVTEQYMSYVELIRASNLELAADYLVMAASLMQIKSRLLLPVTRVDSDEEVEDPQAELAKRLLEYERMKLASMDLDKVPRNGRDFWKAYVLIEQTQDAIFPDVSPDELARVWASVVEQSKLKINHQISRQELSVREFMTQIMKHIDESPCVEFCSLFEPGCGIEVALVNYLAILELAKDGLISITQAVPFAPLYVTRKAMTLA